ncbi:MAG: hypothetical protein HS118_00175 [Bacteroidia bacterium]|nr:hypothetical protein [Bacteroidia bacterium]
MRASVLSPASHDSLPTQLKPVLIQPISVITNIMADYSSKRDSESLAQLLNQTIANLNEHQLVVKEILADTGYSSGSALKYLESANLTGYIPNFGQYKPERKDLSLTRKRSIPMHTTRWIDGPAASQTHRCQQQGLHPKPIAAAKPFVSTVP